MRLEYMRLEFISWIFEEYLKD